MLKSPFVSGTESWIQTGFLALKIRIFSYLLSVLVQAGDGVGRGDYYLYVIATTTTLNREKKKT